MTDRKDERAGFSLESLLRGLSDLMNQAANLSAELRQHTQPDAKPTVTSKMTIRNAEGEEIGADFFNLSGLAAQVKNWQERKDNEPPPSERRDVVIDVFSDQTAIVAVAEMFGADIDRLKVMVEQNMLVITGEAAGIDYHGEALLPEIVDNSAREQSFRNGVLELRWPLVTKQP